MAWTVKSKDSFLIAEETLTLPASGTVYTSEIDFIDFLAEMPSQYVTLSATASAVAGTNVDVSLHGYATRGTSGGSGNLLVDAPGSIADLTNAAKTASASFNIKAYPAPFYRLGFLVDADNSANTVTATLIVPTK